MKARLFLDQYDNEYKILCFNGTIAIANKNNLEILLKDFHSIEKLHGTLGIWHQSTYKMQSYQEDSKTYAYVTDTNKLVILNFSPFSQLFITNHDLESLNEIISVSEYALAVGKSEEQVKVYLRNNRIPNAKKVGRDWIIHKSSINHYPIDQRINNGKYKKEKN